MHAIQPNIGAGLSTSSSPNSPLRSKVLKSHPDVTSMNVPKMVYIFNCAIKTMMTMISRHIGWCCGCEYKVAWVIQPLLLSCAHLHKIHIIASKIIIIMWICDNINHNRCSSVCETISEVIMSSVLTFNEIFDSSHWNDYDDDDEMMRMRMVMMMMMMPIQLCML